MGTVPVIPEERWGLSLSFQRNERVCPYRSLLSPYLDHSGEGYSPCSDRAVSAARTWGLSS